MSTLKIKIVQLEHAKDLNLPEYKTEQAAGMDLQAAVSEPVTLDPGQRVMIPTGICISLPEHFEAQVRPRSGLAKDHGISMVNTPGTIDADYTGEIQVLMINHGGHAFTFERGERIAQLVIAPVMRAEWERVETLPETGRGEKGFGHTGT